MKLKWTTATWGLLVLSGLLPIGLLSIYAFGVASKSVKDMVQSHHQSAARMTTELLARDFGLCASVLRSLAENPEMVAAVERRDLEGARALLRQAKESFPRVDRLFVTDTEGVMLSDFPQTLESTLESFAHREWFLLVKKTGNPAISSAYKRTDPSPGLAVAVATPILSRQRKEIGMMVCQYPLDEILGRLKQFSLGHSGYVFVIDPNGATAVHPRVSLQDQPSELYAGMPPFEKALSGVAHTTEYFDPLEQRSMVATFLPMALRDRRWVVVVQQPVIEAYAPIQQLAWQIAIVGAVLAVAALGVVLALGRTSARNRRLNKALQQRNHQLQRYESIVELSNDAILGVTLDGQIINWNPAAERIYGYTADEVRNRPASILVPKECTAELPAVFQKIQQGESVVHYETVLLRKGGSEINVSLTVSPIKDEAGAVIGVSAITRDITERKRAEEAFNQERYLVNTLMDNIPDHIYFKDQQSRFLRVNRSMATSFNLKDPAEAVGRTDFDYFSSEHAQQAFADEQEIMRTGQPLVGREEKETWPDGSVSWVSTTKECLRDQDGKISGTFGLSRDITARKEAEAALALKAQELARSNTDLEQFAYVASHDLQEPLRMIASYTQLLARRYKGKLDQDADEFITYAVDGATRMQVMIQDLLSYSRVGTRGKPFAPTDCEEVLTRTLANLKIAIEESQAAITHSPLPTVVADATQLTQLLQNLINNAIKFRRPNEAPQIHLAAELGKTSLTPGGHSTAEWIFSVRDNGLGIEPQYFERIFIIFQRLHTRDRYPGTGIGLAVCKKIVERHGGRIWVESEPGQGTRFSFTIPVNEMEPLDGSND